jgi:hypothetical protein
MIIQSVTHAIRGCATAESSEAIAELIPVPKAMPKSAAILLNGVWSMAYRDWFVEALLAARHHGSGAACREHIERVIAISGPL